jgi:hypothetical protein
MADEIIQELWKIKDGIAKEYACDVKALVKHLRTKNNIGGQHLIDLRAMKHGTEQAPASDARNSRE